MSIAPQPSRDEIREKPWKYIGYRGFSQFVAADDDLFILRRFGALTARTLLAMQDELVEWETKLDELDTNLSKKDAPDVHNGSFRQESSKEKAGVLRTVETKLQAYHDLAIKHSELRAKPPVPSKDVKSVQDWLQDKGNAIAEAEVEYITQSVCDRDLFAMVPKKESPVRRVLERSTHFRHMKMWQVQSSLDDSSVTFASDKRIDAFVTALIVGVGLIMLVVPLWILTVYTDPYQRLGIITGFLVAFLVFVSTTNASRPLEVLLAAAAYAAILVVFMQIPPS